MLRQLLTERFHVLVHRGTTMMSGYGLYIDKHGSKLRPVAIDYQHQGWKAGTSSHNYILPGYIHAQQVNLDGLVSLLAAHAHATIVDFTRLSGFFDVDLHFAPDDSTDSQLPSFFTAVEEQLGLNLRPENVTINTVIIDHLDDSPTPN